MPEFHFDRERHIYTLDGVIIPSITNILHVFSDRELSHVPDQDVVEEARKRGQQAHLDIERFNKGLCDQFESGHTMAWAKFCEDTGFKPTHVEHSTYHPGLRFGCTIDVLGTLPDGRQFLPDVKTGSKYKYLPLQTAGQAMALSSHGICPRDVLRANVYIKPKGEGYSYTIDLHENEGDFEALKNYIGWSRVRDLYV